MMPLAAKSCSLVILYGIGGLSDVGRHAILAALEQNEQEVPNMMKTTEETNEPKTIVDKITVFTEYPELLDETDWECGCPEPHTNPAKSHPDIVHVVKVDNWKDPSNVDTLASYIEKSDGVISCLGHRQPGRKYPKLIERGLVAADGNKQLIEAIRQASNDKKNSRNKPRRVVVMSSVGIQEDWPPMEFHWAGKIMKFIYKRTKASLAFDDLNEMEVAYKNYNENILEDDGSADNNNKIDYLFVRPTGISEDAIPVGTWLLQKEKFHDAVGMNMAKMDVARYMVQEAINPTKHFGGVVIGSELPEPKKKN